MAEEKTFENQIKAFLTNEGCWYIKYWAGGGFTRAGVPDILACIGGRFVAIEVKASDGRPSALQLRTLRRIQRAGGIAILLYPDMFPLFKEYAHWLGIGSTMGNEFYERRFEEVIRKYEKQQ